MQNFFILRPYLLGSARCGECSLFAVNFSRSAQFNSQNILFIESAPLAETYSSYIDDLKQKYEIVGEALN
jgi:hypothetical protein